MKILVIRYRFIGDTILMIPFLRNLRKTYPNAQIDVLIGPVSGEILSTCPYIDNLIEFDTTRKHKYENTKNKKNSFWDYVKILRKNNYNKVYVLKRSFSSAALAFLAGIKERVGYNTEGRGFLLTKKVPYIKNRHEVDCFLDVLTTENFSTDNGYLENWVSALSETKVNDILKNYKISNGTKALIHATSGNEKKQWPNENFAKIVEYLTNEKNIQVFYTGTASDYETYEKIHSYIKTDLKIEPVNLCGKLSILESSALINKMDFAIGSDSGNLHIAASFNKPVIGIYGPMNPQKWLTRGSEHEPVFLDMNCIPCDLKGSCKTDIACIKNISPDIIIDKINIVLKKLSGKKL